MCTPRLSRMLARMLNSATSLLRRRARGRLMRVAAPAIAIAALFPSSALAGTVTQTFSQPGETAFTVPRGVNLIHIDAFGAPGGGTGQAGGAGAEVQGDLSVTAGDRLYLEVGVGGGTANWLANIAGGDGGGESDVRTCSVDAATCSVPGYGTVTSWQTQLLVAGGGGAGAAPAIAPSNGGSGGDAGLLNSIGGDGGAGTQAGGGHGATAGDQGLGGSSLVGGPCGRDGGAGSGGDGFGGGGAGGGGHYGGGAGGG